MHDGKVPADSSSNSGIRNQPVGGSASTLQLIKNPCISFWSSVRRTVIVEEALKCLFLFRLHVWGEQPRLPPKQHDIQRLNRHPAVFCRVKSLGDIFNSRGGRDAGTLAQWSRAFAALAEGLSSALSTHSGLFTATCNSSVPGF